MGLQNSLRLVGPFKHNFKICIYKKVFLYLFIKGEMHNYRLLGSLHNGPPSSTHPPQKKNLLKCLLLLLLLQNPVLWKNPQILSYEIIVSCKAE